MPASRKPPDHPTREAKRALFSGMDRRGRVGARSDIPNSFHANAGMVKNAAVVQRKTPETAIRRLRGCL